jgi:hypothetical protein
LDEEIIDHEIWNGTNRGPYRLSIIARLKGPWVHTVQYIIRLKHPGKGGLDFMLTLDGFKELGELFIALHDFCKEPIFVNEKNIDKLKELLTTENIKNYTRISALKYKERKKLVSVNAED